MDNVSLEYFILYKMCGFWNNGTFTQASSVQEVPAIFKLNELQRLSKTLVYT